jgi:UDP-N-acetylmuramyl pentapeptide phosphotransferase/UDP-N-acetylglucosamine-1-phosphate transferase
MTGNSGVWAFARELVLLAAIGGALSAIFIAALWPLLVRYTVARPNVRSSHKAPTPQGGGIAVIGATTIVIAGTLIAAPTLFIDPRQTTITFAAALGLAIVGITDDVRPLEALPRLILQTLAVAAVTTALPETLRIFPLIPWWLERALLLVGGIWFVNLVNFMDGIDWITVAEMVPVTAALAAFGLFGALPSGATVLAAVLCGAMLGFAPFNRPVARLFLGDVGSLPIGLLVGWLLVELAGHGHLAAALLLPLYYLADATLTLIIRLAKREPVMQAHRSHFYQRAVDAGMTVNQIVTRVFLLNVGLIMLATTTVLVPSRLVNASCFAAGVVLVALLLRIFAGAR